jgi:hypothetical protein
MLQGLALSVKAATKITSADDQGMSLIEDFAKMDKEGLTMMFKLLNYPGGFNAQGNCNVGLKIYAQAQINFADMCFFLDHQTNCIDCGVTCAMVTLVAVMKMKTRRQKEDAHKNPTVIPVTDSKNWPTSMELLLLDQYIRGHWGVKGGPLSYVTCLDLFPPTVSADPGFNTAGSKYNNHNYEIIARQRIVNASTATLSVRVHKKDGMFTDSFLLDRTRVFKMDRE